MKSKLLNGLAGLLALASALAVMDLSGVKTFLPPAWVPYIAGIPPIAAAVVHFAMMMGDSLDDGEVNGSWPKKPTTTVKCAPFAFIAALVMALLCTSCSTDAYNVSGVFSIRDAATGAKAALHIEPKIRATK